MQELDAGEEEGEPDKENQKVHETVDEIDHERELPEAEEQAAELFGGRALRVLLVCFREDTACVRKRFHFERAEELSELH